MTPEIYITIGLGLMEFGFQIYYGEKADRRAKELGQKQIMLTEKQIDQQEEALRIQRLQYELEKQTFITKKMTSDSFSTVQPSSVAF